VAAVRNFPRPNNVVELQAFLGLFNYYRRFVPVATRMLKPLTDALQGGLWPQTKVQWSAAMDSAFAAAKAAILAVTSLDHPSPAAQVALITDASGTHVGTVLQQRRGQSAWRPLGFFSAKLSGAESRNSAFDRELLVVSSGILHFRHLLEGRQFMVFSDHKLLAGALTRVSDPRSDRQRYQKSTTKLGPAILWPTHCPGCQQRRLPPLHLHPLHLQPLHIHHLHLHPLHLQPLQLQPHRLHPRLLRQIPWQRQMRAGRFQRRGAAGRLGRLGGSSGGLPGL
jgi:RNase H-like domain found in reverse transcriptase